MFEERNVSFEIAMRLHGHNTVSLAQSVGVKPSHISHIIAHRRMPSLEVAYSISRLLKTPIEHLFFVGHRPENTEPVETVTASSL